MEKEVKNVSNPGEDFENDMYINKWLLRLAHDVTFLGTFQLDYTDQEKFECVQILLDVVRRNMSDIHENYFDVVAEGLKNQKGDNAKEREQFN